MTSAKTSFSGFGVVRQLSSWTELALVFFYLARSRNRFLKGAGFAENC
jgi:hypothetical protein